MYHRYPYRVPAGFQDPSWRNFDAAVIERRGSKE
jgi:hypothetical protein